MYYCRISIHVGNKFHFNAETRDSPKPRVKNRSRIGSKTDNKSLPIPEFNETQYFIINRISCLLCYVNVFRSIATVSFLQSANKNPIMITNYVLPITFHQFYTLLLCNLLYNLKCKITRAGCPKFNALQNNRCTNRLLNMTVTKLYFWEIGF